MIYYGIVDEIKNIHNPGIYGRRKLNKNEAKSYSLPAIVLQKSADFAEILEMCHIHLWSPPLFLFVKLVKWLKNKSKGNIDFQHPIPNSNKTIVIDNELLDDCYNMDDNQSLFYGLFDEFISPEKAFKTIMKSKGGSKLLIIERDKLPMKVEHFGGEFGRFNTGLYCSHPKKTNLLLPLKQSLDLVKKLILAETIRAYESLGAKRIVIEDITTIGAELGGEYDENETKASFKQQKKILEEKEFGKGVFDVERALKNSLFIHDFPNIISVINSRIKGNQTRDKFSETIDLSAGLDVNVLELFKANAKFNYVRKWQFEVEFYDKNEI